MKKILSCALCACMIMSLASCGTESSGSSVSTSNTSSSSPNTQENESLSEAQTDLEALGDIDVEKNLFDVTVTLPAEFVGDATQEELDLMAEKVGVHSITLNEDGSATYVMSKEQHAKLLEETAQSIRTSLNEMVGSEDYPNITAIDANDDFTEFTVTTTSTELDMQEAFSVMGFYMYSGMYGIFSGEAPDNVHVDFVNADTGEVIESSDSKDMEAAS